MIIDIIFNNLKPNTYRFNLIFLIKSEYYVSGVKIKDKTLRGLDSPLSKRKIRTLKSKFSLEYVEIRSCRVGISICTYEIIKITTYMIYA